MDPHAYSSEEEEYELYLGQSSPDNGGRKRKRRTAVSSRHEKAAAVHEKAAAVSDEEESVFSSASDSEEEEEVSFLNENILLARIPPAQWDRRVVDEMNELLIAIGDVAENFVARIKTRSLCNLLVFIKHKYLQSYDTRYILAHSAKILGYFADDKLATSISHAELEFTILNISDDDLIQHSYAALTRLARVHTAMAVKGLCDVLVPEISEAEMPNAIIIKALEMVHRSRDVVFHAVRMHSSCTSIASADLSNYFCFRQIAPFRNDTSGDFLPTQHLIIYITNLIIEGGYVRHKSELWRQEYSGDVYDPATRRVHVNLPTRAFKKYKSILEFIYENVTMERNMAYWCYMTSGNNVATTTETNLLNSTEIPVYNPNRNLHAFRNGIYIIHQHRFIPYYELSQLPVEFRGSHCASYKPDILFDRTRLIDETPEFADWRNISTEAFDKILTYQFEDDHDTIGWFWALVVGKFLYKIGDVEKWQVLAFIVGVAGSGKSTIIKLLTQFYEPGDVEMLSNNMERTFGISALDPAKKLMAYTCAEVRKDFAFDQATLQSMVSGEPVQIRTKYKAPYTAKIDIPGVLCGNQPPMWDNVSNALSRRFVFFNFAKYVRNTDTELDDKLKADIAAVMVKGNLAYRYYAERFRNDDMWQHASEGMLRARNKFEAVMNPVQAFLLEKSAFELGGPSDVLPFRLFQHLVIDYASRNSIKLQQGTFDRDAIVPILISNGLRFVDGPQEYKGVVATNQYVVNFRLSDWAEAYLEHKTGGRM